MKISTIILILLGAVAVWFLFFRKNTTSQPTAGATPSNALGIWGALFPDMQTIAPNFLYPVSNSMY